ncbi:hypothetical protein B0T09DRAFT_142517 [Sordaria sp. MPI-SDFR-AT-0083]|nr:hypothetical protein B0T09DRAFT_142517 [Sordaria sp. MPI-SDFR-AT-0083]
MAGRASYPDLGRTAPGPDRSARWERDRFYDEREQNMTLERHIGRGPDREPRFDALPIRTRNPHDDDDYFRQDRRVPPPREHSVDERYTHDRRGRRPHIDEEEDDELLIRERRRVMYDDMETPRPPSTMRRRPSPSESSFTRRRPSPERERFRSPSPPRRPTARMMRRTSSVDTYDRKPKGFYDREEYGPPPRRSDYRIPANVPIPLPRHKALPPPRVYAEHDYFRDIQVSDPHRYGDEEFHAFQGGEKVREREIEKEVIHTRRSRRDRSRDSRASRATSRSHRSSRRSRSVASTSSSSSSSSSGGTTITSRSEYPKKGKTRIPTRLLSRRALIESGYPFVEEGNTTIIQKALGQEHIDHLLKMSDEYKKAELEIQASRSSAGDIIEEREEHRTEIIECTDTAMPGPPHHTTHYTQTTTHPPHPHVHTTTVHTHPPVQATYTQPVMVNTAVPVQTREVDFAKTVQVRDVSPSRASSYSSWDSASSWTDSTYTTGTSCSTCSTATVTPRGHVHTPQVVHVAHPREMPGGGELMVLDKSHSMSRSRSRHQSRSRHSRSKSRHSRSKSRHRSYESESIRSEIDRLERQLARKERHGSRGDLVRAERLSTGELVLLEEEVERIEEPSRGVRLEKDKRGRLSISVPRNRR